MNCLHVLTGLKISSRVVGNVLDRKSYLNESVESVHELLLRQLSIHML